MLLLQFAIGAVNDIVDAPRDAGRKAGKPIPEGVVTLRAARVVAGASAAGGLVLALVGGPWLVALAVVVLAIGLAYDLVAKGTTLSWLPFAVGIPLLPVFGWFGATGTLPGVFLVLVPAAANAGTALAISNAIVDMERDEEAGVESIALALGADRASIARARPPRGRRRCSPSPPRWSLGAPAGWVVAIMLAALAPACAAPSSASSPRRREDTGWRELAWEVQAVGTGLLAVAWLGALSASAGTPLGS